MRLKKCCSLIILVVTITALVSMGILAGCTKEVSSIDSSIEVDTVLAQKLDEFVSAFNETSSNQKINGNILIAKEGKIITIRSYGMADIINNIPVTEDTVFRIASTTKFFTALGIMQLYEKGLLDLNDKVSKYFPEQQRGDEITIHHLLTHTSGITADISLGSGTEVFSYIPKEKFIEVINKRNLDYEPGEKMKYSNLGYTLLADIIEKVSGMAYEEYMKKNIFNPAGMNMTGCDKSKDKINNLALPYVTFGDKVSESRQYDMSNFIGSGNIYSTVKDMYLFDLALHEEKLISKATLEIMTKIHISESKGWNYGYGCEIGDVKGHRWFGHPGNYPYGYTSCYMSFLDDGLTVIMQNNKNWYENDSIARAIGAIALGEEYRLPTKKKDIRMGQSLLKKYEGRYRKPDGAILNVKVYNNALTVSSCDTTIIIHPCTETEFVDRDYEYWDHIFEFDKSGKVTAYILRNIIDETRMEKIE